MADVEAKTVKLECAHCIQERITEGKWDRIGTTAQQELEATCDRHLHECLKHVEGTGILEWEEWATQLRGEIERRHEANKDRT